ncbi:hypothetical protein ACFOEZ_20495 [Tianweitania populi]|uniref:DNA-binding protein n=1 Tax=Tianweitania populi TaxID=1607949 RepID=A0A8J3GMU7_9HYPH|nr:hypothetical protein [Tianweitania populi]GHD20834.1 hypothetical protein GCM10016234_33710 [Tianweitania populi]
MSPENEAIQIKTERPAPSLVGGGRTKAALFGIGLLVLGLAGGAGATAALSPDESTVLMKPVAVNTLEDGTRAAIKGTVGDVFGNRFVLADQSGRALIDSGWRGEGGDLVKPGETVTVQGRFDRGSLRAEVLVRADGAAQSLKPPKPGPRGWVERLGHGHVRVAEEPTLP